MTIYSAMEIVLISLILICGVDFGEAVQNVYVDDTGGYSGILVAIDPAVPYHNTIIPTIQEYLTQASEVLREATVRDALEPRYFRDVTILVPRTWPQLDTCSMVTSENSADANFVVAPESEQWGSAPHTIRFDNRCGTTDGYTVLPLSFLQDRHEATKYGHNIGKTLVHEWAHQRYGVYDESNAQSCITVEGHGFPQKCTSGIQGDMTWNGRTCSFVPHINQPSGVEGSLMYLPYLNTANSFCDGNVNGQVDQHHENITNEHNDRCDGKSALDVLKTHPDFGVNYIRSVRGGNPQFRCVQKNTITKMVLALDVSRSMRIQGRLEQMENDITEFLLSTPCSDTVVGMVEFSDFSQERTIHRMVSLSDPANVHSLISTLPNRAMDRTCIACGIRQSIRTMQYSGYDTEGAIVAVFTDGMENEEQLALADIRSEIEDSGIIIYASVLQNIETNEELLDIISSTGGQYCQLYDDKTTTYRDCLDKILNHNSPRLQTTSILVVSQNEYIPSNGRVIEGSFYFDTSLNGVPVFQLEWTDGRKEACAGLAVELISPAGEVIRDTSAVRTETSIKIDTSLPQFGEWRYRLWNTGESMCTARLQVESGLVQQECHSFTPNQQLLSLAVLISDRDMNDPTVFYATLTAGSTPITGASVVAHITNSRDEIVEIELWDNGAGADLRADDGIYSRYCILEDDQIFEVLNAKFVARWTPTSSAQLSSSSYGMGAKPLPNYYQKPISNLQRVERFERASVGHLFRVGAYGIWGNERPAKITDLRLHEAHFPSRNVTFAWTAVGYNMDHGTAMSYEIRISDDIRGLREFRSESTLASFTFLNPLEAGAKEEKELTLAHIPAIESDTVYFAAIVAHSERRTSHVSNVAMLILSPSPEFEEQKSNQPEGFPLLIVYIILGAMVIMVLSIVVCVVICKKRCLNKQNHEKNEITIVDDDNTYIEVPDNSLDTHLDVHSLGKEPQMCSSDENHSGLVDQIAIIKARMRHVDGPPSLSRKDGYNLQFSDSASDTSSEKTTSSSKPILEDNFKAKPIPRVKVPGHAVPVKRLRRSASPCKVRTSTAEERFWMNPNEPMQNHPYSNPLYGDSQIVPEIEIRNSAISS